MHFRGIGCVRVAFKESVYQATGIDEGSKNRSSRGGRVMPVEASDFAAKSALFLPKEAQHDW